MRRSARFTAPGWSPNPGPWFWPVELTRDDYRRAAQLVLEYASLPLGTTDATVIALCERLGLAEVATLDRKHFTVIRPLHVGALTLLPE